MNKARVCLPGYCTDKHLDAVRKMLGILCKTTSEHYDETLECNVVDVELEGENIQRILTDMDACDYITLVRGGDEV